MNASDKQVPHHSQPKGTAAEGLQRWAMMTEILSCLPVLPSGGRTRYDCLVKYSFPTDPSANTATPSAKNTKPIILI